jgi:hypothetical protein
MSAESVGEKIADKSLIRQFSTARTAVLLMKTEMALWKRHQSGIVFRVTGRVR